MERSRVFQFEAFPVELLVVHPDNVTLAGLRVAGLPGPDRLEMTPFEVVGAVQRIERDGRAMLATRYRAEAYSRQPGIIETEPRLSFSVIRERRQPGYFFQRIEQSGWAAPGPLVIRVMELPAANRPAGFDGPVGRLEMSTGVESLTPVTVGTLLRLRTVIAGVGRFGTFPAPQPLEPVPAGLRWYDARSVEADGNLRIFEQIVVPVQSGDILIPQIGLTVFDPYDQIYRILTNGPFRVIVEEWDDLNAEISGVAFGDHLDAAARPTPMPCRDLERECRTRRPTSAVVERLLWWTPLLALGLTGFRRLRRLRACKNKIA